MAHPKHPPSTPGNDAPAAKAHLSALTTVLRRLGAWSWRNPLQAAIMVGIVLLPVAPIVVVQLALSQHQRPAEAKHLPDEALAALASGNFGEAARIVRAFGGDEPMTVDEMVARPFVLGAVADHRAERMLGREQPRHRLLAAQWLTEARKIGFPPGYEAEGLYLLGKNLYLGGQVAQSMPIMQEALPLNAEHASELHHLLAGAYLDQPQPQWAEALAHNTQYLSDESLSDSQRQAGLLERSQIEFGLGDYGNCRQTLEQIPANSPLANEAALMRSLLIIEEARSLAEGHIPPPELALAKYREALALLPAASKANVPSQATLAAVEYLRGVCLLEMDDETAALEQLERTHLHYRDTEAGFAAGYAAAERLRRLGRTAEAMQWYRGALGAVDSEMTFKNRWVTLDSLRSNSLDAYQEFLRRQQFESAVDLAGLMRPVFSPARSLQLQAQARAQWGRHLLNEAAAATPDKAGSLTSAGRQQLREAGRLYHRLADLRTASREYPDDLYDAAEADLAGHDYTGAIESFEKYLSVESRRRRPRVLVALGEALLAQDRPGEALKSLDECLEVHPRDPATFEGRLLASRAYWEQGQLEPAERLLLENLNGDALEPSSNEWRASLFALGRLLYQAGRYDEAIRRLEEAAQRYPNAPEAPETRYLAAESYRRSALGVQQQATQEATAEGRLARRRQWTELLEKGLERFEQELNAMINRQDQRALSSLEESILRNCYFARGAVLFELGRYPEAIQAYASATNRYQQTPEALEAYVQIAACYRRLGQEVEARSTLEQAKYTLKHLPDDANYAETTNYSRDEWIRLLDTLGTL
ncbi:MAG TPA: tetratricopeptide repeat protein [Pirellulales bacterium]|nr:tetratricopeptide repeat protein [Pirellulales bacterium]